jgi:S1-C subfamily serine protease
MRAPYRYLLAATVGALIVMGVDMLGFGPGSTTGPSRLVASSGLAAQAIYSRSASSVLEVTVDLSATTTSPNDNYYGSGFVIDRWRHVLTNYHVVAKARRVYVTLPDQHRLVARVIGKDPSDDLAVLSVSGSEPLGRPLVFGNSQKLRVGDPVLAIGNPLGLSRSASTGLVSALNRELQAPNDYVVSNVIEFNASLDHGSSGGPLFDAQGKVVGITSAIAAEGSRFGFAISSYTIGRVLPQLLKGDRAWHAWMGVLIEDITPALAGSLNLPATGALVASVTTNGPAASAGIHAGTRKVVVSGQHYAIGGDLIVAVDGQVITNSVDLSSIIAAHRPGDVIRLRIWRHSQIHTVTIRLGTRH